MTIHQPITTVLFDLDGTIADTNEIILRTIAETLAWASGRPWRREELLPHWGMKLRDQLRVLHPAIDLERAVSFYRARYAQHQQLLAEFPGMRGVLAQLQAAGCRLGVVTSKKRDSAEQTLAGLGYRQFFAQVVVEEDTPRHKPAPDPLLYALARLGARAAEAIYVGDNPDDVTAAHAAGLRAVAVGWCLRPREELLAVHADYLIEHPAELLRYVAHLSAGDQTGGLSCPCAAIW